MEGQISLIEVRITGRSSHFGTNIGKPETSSFEFIRSFVDCRHPKAGSIFSSKSYIVIKSICLSICDIQEKFEYRKREDFISFKTQYQQSPSLADTTTSVTFRQTHEFLLVKKRKLCATADTLLYAKTSVVSISHICPLF